jgi:hypothetical protein
MKKINHAEQLNFLHIENVLLKAQIGALTDLFSTHYLAHGTFSKDSFDNILIIPRKIEHLRRVLGSNRFLTNSEKVEILKSLQP